MRRLRVLKSRMETTPDGQVWRRPGILAISRKVDGAAGARHANKKCGATNAERDIVKRAISRHWGCAIRPERG